MGGNHEFCPLAESRISAGIITKSSTRQHRGREEGRKRESGEREREIGRRRV